MWDTLTLGIWKFRFFNRFVRDNFSFRGHVTLFHQHTRLHIRNNPHHSGNCSSQRSITQLFETHSLPPPPCCAPSSKISDFRVGIQVGSLPVHGSTKNSLRDIVMQKVGKDYNKDAKRQRRTLRFIFLAEKTVKGRRTALQFTLVSLWSEYVHI